MSFPNWTSSISSQKVSNSGGMAFSSLAYKESFVYRFLRFLHRFHRSSWLGLLIISQIVWCVFWIARLSEALSDPLLVPSELRELKLVSLSPSSSPFLSRFLLPLLERLQICGHFVGNLPNFCVLGNDKVKFQSCCEGWDNKNSLSVGKMIIRKKSSVWDLLFFLLLQILSSRGLLCNYLQISPPNLHF